MSTDYLRVSVTDECNLRCVYCNPGGGSRLGRGGILSRDEIRRVVELCAACGIRRVRLTGGEPLVREDLLDIVRDLAVIPGLEDLSLTSNGVLLAPIATELKAAGLKRVNVSLDAAEPECYERMAGADRLAQVLDGIRKAMEVGLNPVRINCVVVADMNLSQVPALAAMSIDLPLAVRFIEYCPTTRLAGPAGCFVPNREVHSIIESRFGPLSDLVMPDTGGPATYFRIAGASGAVGFISGRSSVFCHRCTRLRLTSDGRLRPCLHAGRHYDVKRLLRSGAPDEAIANLIGTVLQEKSRYTKLNSTVDDFLMQHIGG